MAEVKRYPDGTEIQQFPRWVYPGGKIARNPENRFEHNGVLVQNEMELEQALVRFGDKQLSKDAGPQEKPKAGW